VSLQAHGGFDEIYDHLKAQTQAKGWETIDLVIIGGDFQVGFILILSLLIQSRLNLT
jgi:hypothetical protein